MILPSDCHATAVAYQLVAQGRCPLPRTASLSTTVSRFDRVPELQSHYCFCKHCDHVCWTKRILGQIVFESWYSYTVTCYDWQDTDILMHAVRIIMISLKLRITYACLVAWKHISYDVTWQGKRKAFGPDQAALNTSWLIDPVIAEIYQSRHFFAAWSNVPYWIDSLSYLLLVHGKCCCAWATFVESWVSASVVQRCLARQVSCGSF